MHYKYDIAFSFLSESGQIARELQQRLNPNLRVFVYFDKQEDLVGTDGFESFRQIFYEESRLVVVIYKNGWGETPWTRVEEAAIKDRCLTKGWAGLLFIMADSKDSPPIWLPQTNIRLHLQDYGMEQAVGAIKALVESLGGQLLKETAIDRAKRLQGELGFRANRRKLLSSDEGVREATKEALKIHGGIRALIEKIRAESGALTVEAGSDDEKTVLTTGRVSLVVYWRPSYSNTLEHSPLLVREFNGRVLLPEQRGKSHLISEPDLLTEHEFDPDLTSDQGWCWHSRFAPQRYFSSMEVAEHCVRLFLDLIDRADKGDVPPFDPFRSDRSERPDVGFMAS